MRIIKCFLSMTLAVITMFNWFWYMLITSDVPHVFTGNDINITICMFTLTLIILIIEVVIVEKGKTKGSYLVLITGFLSLVLWMMTYRGGNFNIGNMSTNLFSKRMIIAGIIISALLVGSQTLQILLFYKRKITTTK